MTNKPKAISLDVATGISSERDLTVEEIYEIEQFQIENAKLIEQEQAKALARESALAKLAAIGLTEEEIRSL